MEPLSVSDAEERLLKHCSVRYQTSLHQIRQAVANLWASDAPRIVREFTDHGLEHSVRLVGFLLDLLRAERTGNASLSEQELYVAMAAIYLHDIGMQCDVARRPDIVAQAKTMGADFEQQFEASSAARYSEDEQRVIRANHSLLSSAWIEQAYQNGDPVSGFESAVKGIESSLVEAVSLGCQYHSKLDIKDCPESLENDPKFRMRLVAALVRFADELDIGRSRVTPEVAQAFRMDSGAELYWWFHGATNVVTEDPSQIMLIIQLNPADVDSFGEKIHDAFIGRFCTKNQDTLRILQNNGYNVSISTHTASGRSGVVPYRFVERLPVRIASLLRGEEEEGADNRKSSRSAPGSITYEALMEDNQRLRKALQAEQARQRADVNNPKTPPPAPKETDMASPDPDEVTRRRCAQLLALLDRQNQQAKDEEVLCGRPKAQTVAEIARLEFQIDRLNCFHNNSRG